MHYITVTELESPGATSCKIKGLSSVSIRSLETCFKEHHMNYFTQQDAKVLEVDADGVVVLNLISGEEYCKVVAQSTVIEESNIGGRTDKIQKTIWTLAKQ